jgi:hypothetical protein
MAQSLAAALGMFLSALAPATVFAQCLTRGKLIAENGTAGTVKRETFYLGDIPAAVFQ